MRHDAGVRKLRIAARHRAPGRPLKSPATSVGGSSAARSPSRLARWCHWPPGQGQRMCSDTMVTGWPPKIDPPRGEAALRPASAEARPRRRGGATGRSRREPRRAVAVKAVRIAIRQPVEGRRPLTVASCSARTSGERRPMSWIAAARIRRVPAQIHLQQRVAVAARRAAPAASSGSIVGRDAERGEGGDRHRQQPGNREPGDDQQHPAQNSRTAAWARKCASESKNGTDGAKEARDQRPGRRRASRQG